LHFPGLKAGVKVEQRLCKHNLSSDRYQLSV